MLPANLNILNPRQAVEANLQAPTPILALALVLVASIVALLQPLMLGLYINPVAFLVNFVLSSYIKFFILAIVVYALLLVLKKENSAGKLPGIVSTLGLLQIPVIVLLVVSGLTAPMVISPITTELMQEASHGEADVDTLMLQLAFLDENEYELVNFTAFYTLLGLAIVIGIINLYILYLLASRLFQYRVGANILVLIAALIITGLLQGIVPI